MKSKVSILEPIEVSPCKYEWQELEVRASQEPGAGDGVFARVNLPAGTVIPILGKIITGEKFAAMEADRTATHVWNYYQNDVIVDGNPALNKHGLNIAMMINEPLKKKPNCVFKLNSVVVARPIKKGEELILHHGSARKLAIVKGLNWTTVLFLFLFW